MDSMISIRNIETTATPPRGKADGWQVNDLIAGRYEVRGELGKGGMGIVYRCYDRKSGIDVALKTISPELAQSGWEMDEIRRNFQLVYNLHHPHIASYNTLESDEAGNCFLVMEFVDGEELRYFLRRKRKENEFTEALVIKLVKQIASALDYAHKKSIVHKDIKPANIMVDRNGEVKILDFGLAAQIHSSLSRVTNVQDKDTSGTMPYIAPEQWRGRSAREAADQYALAATVYEIFSGTPPFDSSDKEILRECAIKEIPDRLTGVSGAIADAVAKALSKEPQDRFPNCTAFAEAMVGSVEAVKVERVEKEEEKSDTPDVPDNKRSKLLAIFAVVLCAAVITGLVINSQVEARRAEEARWAEEVVFTLKNGVKLEMVKIKAGSFLMGSPVGELGRDGDEKQHSVTLTKDYWIGKYEVTQEQWQAEMGSNPSYFKGSNRPVECVSWKDAIEFCRRLNERYAGKLPVINGVRYQFDLPTEAQWEYACRAGTTTSLNSGENIQILGLNNSPNLDKVGWYGGNCGQDFELSNGYDISFWQQRQYSDTRGGTHPVGQKRHNNWGLYDMHGNVFEWCKDWYAKDYPSETVDPVKLVQGNSSSRVCRGGGWNGYAKSCCSAGRDSGKPDIRNCYLGFRLALVPVQ